MLNLEDLAITELHAYCDGLKEAVEIIETTQNKINITKVNDRYFEAQRLLESRVAEEFREKVFDALSSKKNYEVKR